MNAEMLQNDSSASGAWASPTALGLPRVDISALAESVAEQLEYRPGEALEPIVHGLGGRVEFVDIDEDDVNYGSIRVSPGEFVVSLPLDSGPMRDRFTLAHELGHFVLHYLYQNQVNGAGVEYLKANRYGSDKAEWEANWFAAAFLMPGSAFREAFERFEGDMLAIASFFKVSHAAANVRAKSLNLLPRG